nr:hypothetical protein [Clostridia bacterium]
MYNRTIWVDETDEFENRFRETANEDGTITHTKETGEVYVEGTPQSAENFNNMEDGIEDAHIGAAQTLIGVRQNTWRIEDLEKATIQETGTVNLTNTQAFPFNNSKKTVALTNVRDNLNYIVVVVSKTASDNGNIGEIEITERQVNGFKIEYTGSSSAVTVVYAVIGGYDQ